MAQGFGATDNYGQEKNDWPLGPIDRQVRQGVEL